MDDFMESLLRSLARDLGLPLREKEGLHGLTNFSWEELEIYSEAVRRYEEKFGVKCLRIEFESIPVAGGSPDSYCSLWTTENRNLGPFWDIFDEVKKFVKWQQGGAL